MIAAALAFGLALSAAPQAAAPDADEPPSVPVEERGLAIGARVPPFDAVDQTGARRTLESLAGREGLVLLFVRSADW